MSIKIEKLKGVSPAVAVALRDLGVRNSDDLLALTATPAQRRDLAARLAVDGDVVLELANRADLARINGIGGIYADLLEHTGVDTVKELARRRPDHLYQAIHSANQQKGLAKMPPSEDMVDGWINQARHISPALQY